MWRKWILNRPLVLWPAIAVVIGGCALVWLSQRTNPSEPEFVVLGPGEKTPPYTKLIYDFLDPKLFQNGQLWVTIGSTNQKFRTFLYDIENKGPRGELVNAWRSGVISEDGSRVLVTVDRMSPKMRLFRMIETITGMKIGNQYREEYFALMDLRNNKVIHLGSLHQWAGAGSTWKPSPTSRFAFNRSTTEMRKSFHLLDLQKATMDRVPLNGDPVGWWDDNRIVLRTTGGDYDLLDVATRQRTSLVTSNAVAAFLQQGNVVDPFESTEAFFSGPGWFITGQQKQWLATNSFLLKLDQPSGALSLVSTNFQFGWSDSFDKTGRYYVYSGRKSGQQNGAVFLRDLKTDTTTTLVPDDGGNQFSIPRWYGENIIYTRSQMLWQVSILNTNPVQVFPPPQ